MYTSELEITTSNTTVSDEVASTGITWDLESAPAYTLYIKNVGMTTVYLGETNSGTESMYPLDAGEKIEITVYREKDLGARTASGTGTLRCLMVLH